MNTSIFVLIPGACHSALCWQRIVPLLEQHGHHVVTPDLLGIGEDHTPLSQIKLSSWVDQIVDIVEHQSKPVVLLGHSSGGLTISEVAERVPMKIKLLVYLSGFLIPSGENLLQNYIEPEDGSFLVHNPDSTTNFAPEKIISSLYNTTSPEWAERVPGILSPIPSNIFTTPLKLTDDHFGTVPRAFIECTQDNAISLANQRALHGRLPCKYVITLVTDHSPFFSAPEELAAALLDLATRQ